MNIEQERAEFEAWMRKEHPDHSLEYVNGRYTYSPPQRLWEAYQAGRAALQSKDAEDGERLDWLLRQLPGDAIRYCVGVIADTADIDEFRAAIDHARRVEGEGK